MIFLGISAYESGTLHSSSNISPKEMPCNHSCPLSSNTSPGNLKPWRMGSRSECLWAASYIGVFLEIQSLATWSQHSERTTFVINIVLVTCELLNCPFQSIILRNVVSMTSWWVEGRTLNIFRNRNKNINIVCNTSLFVVTLHFHNKSDSRVGRILNYYINRKQRFDPNIQPVTHQLEFSIRRNESYQSFVLKFTQPHTLMEFDIIELNSFIFRSSSLSLIVSLVI